jgi:hypothetical protein
VAPEELEALDELEALELLVPDAPEELVVAPEVVVPEVVVPEVVVPEVVVEVVLPLLEPPSPFAAPPLAPVELVALLAPPPPVCRPELLALLAGAGAFIPPAPRAPPFDVPAGAAPEELWLGAPPEPTRSAP